ncbi:MAG TPA: FAD-dependent oxidoreductase, partial [Acidimicrobiales bacterium]
MTVDDHRCTSLWLDDVANDPSLGDSLVPRAGLPGDVDVDVAIVGGGFTGLWTALYLCDADPTMRIAVIEANIAGFGASGRNGGWCSALLPMSLDGLAQAHGAAAATAMLHEMKHTVDEVLSRAAAEGINCQAVKGGTLTLARSPLQVSRLRAALSEPRRYGFGEEDLRWLTRSEARSLVGADGVLGGLFTPHCAAIQPARLARGLARAVEARGVTIYESTRARMLEAGSVVTDRGTVKAAVVVRATEGFTPTLAGQRRAVVPIYSLMVATAPLPQSFWDEVGWEGRATLNDGRNGVIYGQRTADGRIAFGGRGARYHYGSAVDARFDTDRAVHRELPGVLASLFPALHDVEVTHRWGGPLAAPRDWHCSVGFDPATGMGWAGGYVGDGVATANLAGR